MRGYLLLAVQIHCAMTSHSHKSNVSFSKIFTPQNTSNWLEASNFFCSLIDIRKDVTHIYDSQGKRLDLEIKHLKELRDAAEYPPVSKRILAKHQIDETHFIPHSTSPTTTTSSVASSQRPTNPFLPVAIAVLACTSWPLL